MFVQRGYEGTTMRAIADAIGYTPTAIYHHFKDKDALVAELAALDFRVLTLAFRRTATVDDPVDRFEQIGAAYVEFAVTHPMHYQFLFMTRGPKDKAHDGMRRDPGEEAYGFLQQTCTEVIATGRLRSEFTDPDELAQMAWGALHGIVALQIAKKGDYPWRDLRRTAAKIRTTMIRGWLREPGR